MVGYQDVAGLGWVHPVYQDHGGCRGQLLWPAVAGLGDLSFCSCKSKTAHNWAGSFSVEVGFNLTVFIDTSHFITKIILVTVNFKCRRF